MGNADLRELATIEEVPWSEVEPGVVAVDAHNWLYRYLTTTVRFTNESVYTTAAGDEVANLVGIVQGLPKFFEHDLTPVFVFDGGPSELKADEIAERREQREKLEDQLADARDEGDAAEVARLDSATQRLTDVIQETSRELLSLLDVPVIEAPAEGEAQAAHMAARGDVEYVGTEDYDALLFGAPVTLRQLTSKGNPERMDLDATLRDLDVTHEQLVDVAILCGTDFNDGVRGYGPKTALKAVKEHGDLWAVMEHEDVVVENADLVRELFFDPDVTSDYEFDTTISPDVDAARAYVTEDWEVPGDEVSRGFERIEDALTQTGLDDWT
jgi:flap endonuclease-1